MANIVSIDTGTFNEAQNKISDIVSIHDDKVILGPAYDTFKITHISDMTAKEIETVFNTLTSEKDVAYKAEKTEWTFESPEVKEVWRDSAGDWKFIENKPKYSFTLSSLTNEDLVELNKDGVIVSKVVKKSILSKCIEKISADPLNQAKATDLNKVAVVG